MVCVCWLVGCLTSQQHASVSQGRICSNRFTCCHTEMEVADPTFYLTQSQYTDTGPTSPSPDLITPGAWQGSQWVTGMTRPGKIPSQAGFEPRIFRSRGGRLNRWASDAVLRADEVPCFERGRPELRFQAESRTRQEPALQALLADTSAHVSP